MEVEWKIISRGFRCKHYIFYVRLCVYFLPFKTSIVRNTNDMKRLNIREAAGHKYYCKRALLKSVNSQRQQHSWKILRSRGKKRGRGCCFISYSWQEFFKSSWSSFLDFSCEGRRLEENVDFDSCPKSIWLRSGLNNCAKIHNRTKRGKNKR